MTVVVHNECQSVLKEYNENKLIAVRKTAKLKFIGPKIAQTLASKVTANKPKTLVKVIFRNGIPNSFEKLIPKLEAVTKTYNQLSRISTIGSND